MLERGKKERLGTPEVLRRVMAAGTTRDMGYFWQYEAIRSRVLCIDAVLFVEVAWGMMGSAHGVALSGDSDRYREVFYASPQNGIFDDMQRD